MPGSRKAPPEDWPSQDKFAVVMETPILNAQELSKYYRSKGLYPEQIENCETSTQFDAMIIARHPILQC